MDIYQVAELTRLCRRRKRTTPPTPAAPIGVPVAGRLTAFSMAPTAFDLRAVSPTMHPVPTTAGR